DSAPRRARAAAGPPRSRPSRSRAAPHAAARAARTRSSGPRIGGLAGRPTPSHPPAGAPRSAEVEGEEVVDRLASHDLAGLAVADGDDARAGQLVVAAREAAPVGAGDRDREQVAGADVAGQHDVADDDVAALAVLADHAREPRR